MNRIKSIASSLGGRDSQYRSLHLWVEKVKGKPNKCEMCGRIDATRYHWANISEEYKRIPEDWRRLCVPCHKREKHPGHCVKGHEMTSDNTYTYPRGYTECRECRRAGRKPYTPKSSPFKAIKGR